MTCDVCGQRMIGRCLKLSDGRRWCAFHPRSPACAYCSIPLGAASGPVCAACGRSAVRTIEDVQPYKAALRDHMDRIGLLLPARTRILLALEGQVFASATGIGPAHLGDTTWSYSGKRLTGPITIRIAGGLPGHLFVRTLAHEFGHAAMVSGVTTAGLPLPLREGFAECVAAAHLATISTPQARKQLRDLTENPDPVYGGGFRRVRDAVEAHGLVPVCQAMLEGRPDTVGLLVGPEASGRRSGSVRK